MTWELRIPATPRDQFAKAVDDAVPTTSQAEDVIADDLATAKRVLKDLGARLGTANVGGGIDGHTPEAPYLSPSLTINIFGYDEE